MSEKTGSKRGIRQRRAEKKREKALRTGDSPEKVAERGERTDDPALKAAMDRARIAMGGGAGGC
jgi:hypothetical protein